MTTTQCGEFVTRCAKAFPELPHTDHDDDMAPPAMLEAIGRYLAGVEDDELVVDTSIALDYRITPAGIAAIAGEPAPPSIHRRRINDPQFRSTTLHGSFTVAGGRWNGEAWVTTRPGGLRDWLDRDYGFGEPTIVHRTSLAEEIDLLAQFRRLLHLP